MPTANRPPEAASGPPPRIGGEAHAVHSHAGHSHAGHIHSLDGGPSGGGASQTRRLGWAFAIIALFTLAEAAGGLTAGSLALLADAGHMASDAVALGMSWLALHLSRRPADAARSYGYQRLEVLAAFVNGCTLFLVALAILVEALRRFAAPVHVLGGWMLGVAVIGLLANLVAFLILNGGNRANLAVRSAWLHVLGDLLGFIATIAAAGVILATGWTPIDPLLSLFVAFLILRSAARIVRSSGHILLEGTPPGFDPALLQADLAAAVPAIADVHHIHAWALTAGQLVVTLHVRGRPGADAATLIPAIDRRLKERFGITHSTIQLDPADCPDEQPCA